MPNRVCIGCTKPIRFWHRWKPALCGYGQREHDRCWHQRIQFITDDTNRQLAELIGEMNSFDGDRVDYIRIRNLLLGPPPSPTR